MLQKNGIEPHNVWEKHIVTSHMTIAMGCTSEFGYSSGWKNTTHTGVEDLKHIPSRLAYKSLNPAPSKRHR